MLTYRPYRLTLFTVLWLAAASLSAQTYKQRYKVAKDLFLRGEYRVAMETFKPLLTAKATPYTRYAAFYYATSAYFEKHYEVAKKHYYQLLKAHPQWTQRQEVYYWLARTFFHQRNYFQAMGQLRNCTEGSVAESATKLEKRILKALNDVEIIRMMLEEYPTDTLIARRLVEAIATDSEADAYASLSDSVRSAFSLSEDDEKVDMIPHKKIYKDRYTVALLFPFLVDRLKVALQPMVNQSVIDLYRGMAMAVDTLAQQDIHIDLELYDTQRSAEVTADLLRKKSLARSDLLVGPLFANQIPLVREFSKTHRINMINPVSGNAEFLQDNPYALLYAPRHRTVGRRAAEWLYHQTPHRTCMVFFEARSAQQAALKGFLERAKELDIAITVVKRVDRENAEDIHPFLATPTELDELGNPTEFEIPQNSIGGIFVASDDPLIYTKVISGVDTRGDNTVVLGHQRWLSGDVANFDAYERLHIVMAAPMFYPPSAPHTQKFEAQFIQKYGVIPGQYAKTGYEFMWFVGHCLDRYGVYFQTGLHEQEFVEGYMSKGYNYQGERSNQFVPFIYFREGELVVAD